MKQSHNRRWRGLARPAAAAVVGVSGAVLTTVLAYRVGGVIGSVIGVGGGVIGAVLTTVLAVILTLAALWAAMLAVVVAPLEAHSFLSRRLSERWATTGSWRQSAGARVLSLPLRIAFGPRGEDKLEEWLAELAAIESRWARWVYLLDLLFDLPLQARAAREATREGPR